MSPRELNYGCNFCPSCCYGRLIPEHQSDSRIQIINYNKYKKLIDCGPITICLLCLQLTQIQISAPFVAHTVCNYYVVMEKHNPVPFSLCVCARQKGFTELTSSSLLSCRYNLVFSRRFCL